MTNTDKDWDRRVLCSDGNCIGVIGSDGRCKVCGLPYEGELPIPAEDASEAGDEIDNVSSEALITGEQIPETDELEPEEGKDAGDDWEDRILCIDGNCIGIVGPDGRCKLCGKPHPGKES